MEVIDPGHHYLLDTLDGKPEHRRRGLIFVKRCDPPGEFPGKYPGNSGAYHGAIMQDVLRCLIERCQYVNRQRWSVFTLACLWLFRLAIALLEARVMFIKGRFRWPGLYPEKTDYCPACGHFVCADWGRCR